MSPRARAPGRLPGDHPSRSQPLRLDVALTLQDGRYLGDMTSPAPLSGEAVTRAVLGDLETPLSEERYIPLESSRRDPEILG